MERYLITFRVPYSNPETQIYPDKMQRGVSKNPWILQVGRDPEDHPVPNPLDQAAQDPIQPCTELFQG